MRITGITKNRIGPLVAYCQQQEVSKCTKAEHDVLAFSERDSSGLSSPFKNVVLCIGGMQYSSSCITA